MIVSAFLYHLSKLGRMLVISVITLIPLYTHANHQTTKNRLNQALYYLDFCWCMNFVGIFIIGLLVFMGIVANDEDRVSHVARERFFNCKQLRFCFNNGRMTETCDSGGGF
jgi:hypothetical protein